MIRCPDPSALRKPLLRQRARGRAAALACLCLAAALPAPAWTDGGKQGGGEPGKRVVRAGPDRTPRPGSFGAALWAGRVTSGELLAVGAPRAGSDSARPGSVVVLVERAVRWRATGRGHNDLFGSSLASLDLEGSGDVDALAIGAPQDASDFSWNVPGPGPVELRALDTGEVLLEAKGARVGDGFGRALCALGDVDGDGLADLAVGATQTGLTEVGSAPRPGYVTLTSSRDGSSLWTTKGAQPGERFGASLLRVGDADEDGVRDLLVSAPGREGDEAAPGGVVALSARTGAVLFRVDPGEARLRFGIALEPAGDVDGDGCADGVAAGFRRDEAEELHLRIHFVSGADGRTIRTFSRELRTTRLLQRQPALAVNRSSAGTPVVAVGLPWEWSPHFNYGAGVVEVLDWTGGQLERFEADVGLCDDSEHRWCPPPYLGFEVLALPRTADRAQPRWAIASAGLFRWGFVALAGTGRWTERELVREEALLERERGR